MRFVSIILAACIVFLSSFGGIVKPAQPKMMDCCKKMAKMSCHKGEAKNNKAEDGCGQPGRAMMFSCSICGFIPVAKFVLRAVHADNIPKPVAHYILGNSTTYYVDNWKPPKTC